MKRVTITADIVLDFLVQIFTDNDIEMACANEVNRLDAKSLQEALNINYYTFKYRPESTEQIISQLSLTEDEINTMLALRRSFACLTVNQIAPAYNQYIDQQAVDAQLDFWVQTDKIKLVELMLATCRKVSTGLRIPFNFLMGDGTTEYREVVVIFGTIGEPTIDDYSPIGESALLSVPISVVFQEIATNASKYVITFTLPNGVLTDPLPFSSFVMKTTMNGRPLPSMLNASNTGQLNLSAGKQYVLVFDGYNHPFVDYLVSVSLSNQDNNNLLQMHIKRNGESYTEGVIVDNHQISLPNDTSNEVHNVSLITGLQAGITPTRK